MIRLSAAFLVAAPVLAPAGVDAPPREVAVQITHERGSFSGKLTVSLEGSMNKARTSWNATIRNTSPHKIFKVTFCVKAFDSSDQQIKPGGDECVLRLWGSNWEPGLPLNFKGKQNVKFTGEKTRFR